MKSEYNDTSYFLEIKATICFKNEKNKKTNEESLVFPLIASSLENIDQITMKNANAKELLNYIKTKIIKSSKIDENSNMKALKVMNDFDCYKFNIKDSKETPYSHRVLYSQDENFIDFTNNTILEWINNYKFLETVVLNNYNEAVLKNYINCMKFKCENGFENNSLNTTINRYSELLTNISSLNQKVKSLEESDEELNSKDLNDVMTFWNIISINEEEKPNYSVCRKAYSNIIDFAICNDKTKFFTSKNRKRFENANTQYNNQIEKNEKLIEEQKYENFVKNGEQIEMHL